MKETEKLILAVKFVVEYREVVEGNHNAGADGQSVTRLSILCVEFSGGKILETSWSYSYHKLVSTHNCATCLVSQCYWGLRTLSQFAYIVERERKREWPCQPPPHHIWAKLQTHKELPPPSPISLSLSPSQAKAVHSGFVLPTLWVRDKTLWNDITNQI